MKCKYCGGEVGLEELVCPYCGQPNDQAVLHQKDMAAYRQRFHATETAVRQKAHQYAQIIPRVVLILTLLIGGIIMLAISSEAMYENEYKPGFVFDESGYSDEALLIAAVIGADVDCLTSCAAGAAVSLSPMPSNATRSRISTTRASTCMTVRAVRTESSPHGSTTAKVRKAGKTNGRKDQG